MCAKHYKWIPAYVGDYGNVREVFTEPEEAAYGNKRHGIKQEESGQDAVVDADFGSYEE